MDLQEMVENAVQAKRAEEMKTSEQLTLGELIAKLEPIAEKQKEREEEATVSFDFEYAFPTGVSSWRGSYCELAIEFDFVGYGFGDYTPKDKKEPTVSEFLAMMKKSMGATYTGWKGGDFVMGKTTPLWVANPGNSGETALIDILDEGYSVKLITKYMPYGR
jgi:hypothetical protein